MSLIASFYLTKSLGFNGLGATPIVLFIKSFVSTILFGGVLMVGFLKGWRWSIHVVVFISVFRIFSYLLNFIDLFFLEDFWKNSLFSIISVSLGMMLFYGFI